MADTDGKQDPQMDLVQPEPVTGLPPIVPPQTNAPVHFNQQVNIQQIPPKVWEKLSAEQIVELSKRIMDQVEIFDRRQYEVARRRADDDSKNRRVALYVGAVVSLAGLGLVAYLASNGNGIIAGVIGTFLATILAVVVGNRLTP